MRNAPFRKNLGALTNKAFRVFLTGSIVLSFSPATALASEIPQDGSASSALTSWMQTQKEEPADTSATNIDSTDSSEVENMMLSEGDYTQFTLSPATLSALEVRVKFFGSRAVLSSFGNLLPCGKRAPGLIVSQ